jgi:hypothetical protein
VTFVGADLIVGHYVEGFPQAWQQIAANWHTHEGKRPQDSDRFHVETHLADRRDAFLTGDRALLAMCRRLPDEHRFPVVAMTVAEYLERRDG